MVPHLLRRPQQFLMRVGVLCLCVWLVAACSTRKKLGTQALSPTPKLSAGQLMQRIDSAAARPTWLNARLDMALEIGDQTVDVAGSLRLLRDTSIWLTIRKFGLELARLQITHDSVKAIVPVQKTYVSEDLHILSAKFGVPADFNWLQNFLLGLPVWPIDSSMMQWSAQADHIALTGKGAGYEVSYQTNLAATRIQEGKIGRLTSQDRMVWKHNDWRPLAGYGEFPYFRQWLMTTADGSTSTLDLRFSDVSTEISKPMRFEIPEHYTRMRL